MKPKILGSAHRKARVAARIWMKARQGRALSPRLKRFARILGGDLSVTNNLIGAELGPLEVDMIAKAWSEKRHPAYEPPWSNPPTMAGRSSTSQP